MPKPPLPTPAELRQQRLDMEQRSEREFIRTRKRRLWTAAIIGFLSTTACSVVPNATSQGVWLQIGAVILFGIAWSIIVQFKAVNHLVSCLVFGLVCIIALVTAPTINLFWWLGLVMNGALIGIINEIYRKHILGH